MPDWAIVVPVKGTAGSKSRLGAPASLATAIALDTVDAAIGVGRVIVVTSVDAAPAFAAIGAETVLDPGSGGLNGAIVAGIAAAGDGPVAVLLGDLPALTSTELASTLSLAAGRPLAFVPDADGVGTVLTTALPGSLHLPAFGGGSRAAHLAAGYLELDVPRDSGLRRDVDTAEQLRSIPPERLGARTREALDASEASAN
jgi:2-phospho-L-lactate guanylyltransferase